MTNDSLFCIQDYSKIWLKSFHFFLLLAPVLCFSIYLASTCKVDINAGNPNANRKFVHDFDGTIFEKFIAFYLYVRSTTLELIYGLSLPSWPIYEITLKCFDFHATYIKHV